MFTCILIYIYIWRFRVCLCIQKRKESTGQRLQSELCFQMAHLLAGEQSDTLGLLRLNDRERADIDRSKSSVAMNA